MSALDICPGCKGRGGFDGDEVLKEGARLVNENGQLRQQATSKPPADLPRASRFSEAVDAELKRALNEHGDFASLHEAFAVLLEEVEEFKTEVWKKHGSRDGGRIYDELVQIAAMAGKAARLVLVSLR